MKNNILVLVFALSASFLMSCATAQVATNLTPDKINAALDVYKRQVISGHTTV